MAFRYDQGKMKTAKYKSQNRIKETGSGMLIFTSDHSAFFNLHFAFCNESNYEMLY